VTSWSQVRRWLSAAKPVGARLHRGQQAEVGQLQRQVPLSERRFATAIGDLEAIELDRYPTLALMRRAFDLRANVTAYDVTYVALAEVLGCELLTGDQRLAGSPGARCTIRVLR
jgi:predicted nucleic acid-binding protein